MTNYILNFTLYPSTVSSSIIVHTAQCILINDYIKFIYGDLLSWNKTNTLIDSGVTHKFVTIFNVNYEITQYKLIINLNILKMLAYKIFLGGKEETLSSFVRI